MFRKQDRRRVAEGDITMTFRLWKSAHVKAGRSYQTGFGLVAVDDVEVIPAGMVAPDDLAPAGCSDLASLWALAGEHTGTEVGPETLLHRVEFRFLGDAPQATAKAALSLQEVSARLERMDRLARDGPWTLATLRLIEAGTRVPARLLAADLGQPMLDFKANVRKLKALGLTISHETGYELSDLGRAYLSSLDVAPSPGRDGGQRRRQPR